MGSLQQILEAQRVVKGVATILAIGTAIPPNVISQTDYPDFYFGVTKSNHMSDLKQKFKRICEKSKIEKRHYIYNEEFFKKNSNISTYGAPSLDTRQAVLVKEVPKLGKEAALKAIREWGQPLSQITHLIFYTTSSFGNIPSADYHLAKLLGLSPTVKRLMMFNLGCHSNGAAIRVAKDIAENNVGSRVLVVWVETTLAYFHAPNANHMDVIIGQALFSDGAAATVIGADPNPSLEFPLFQLVSASQTTIPNTQNILHGSPQEMGMVYYLGKELPTILSENVNKFLIDVFSSMGVTSDTDWNKLFYAVHPGGPAILDRVQEKLGLNEDKLRASRHMLSQYGNMWSVSVIFVLDEIRKWSKNVGKSTTGEGLDWGVLVGFGPGLSMEVVVLRSTRLINRTF